MAVYPAPPSLPLIPFSSGCLRRSLETPQFSFSAAISACHKCGEWEMALDLVDSMNQQGLPRNKHALNAAVAACGAAGK